VHYYKFNIADWSLSTSHLSLEEEAIYFRLINHYYDTESPIPVETQPVLRRLRMGSNTDAAALILSEFFELTDKGWIHGRCDKVLKDFKKTAKKNKENGAKGGRPSKDVASSISQEKPSGLISDSQNNPNQELLTNNHKPLTKEKGKRFAPPQVDDVIEHFTKSGFNGMDCRSEAERFINFYESKGWMVGKNKMKNWKAACSNWLKRMEPVKPDQPSSFEELTDRSWADNLIIDSNKLLT